MKLKVYARYSDTVVLEPEEESLEFPTGGADLLWQYKRGVWREIQEESPPIKLETLSAAIEYVTYYKHILYNDFLRKHRNVP